MSRNRCKVDDAVEAYSLRAPRTESGSIHDYLVDRWTGSAGHQAVGYRQLADWFNRRLLRQVYDEHGRSTTGPRVDSEYDALTGDDDLLRQEVVNELASAGIDAEALVDDMVSPRTMHRHLKGCLDAEKAPQEAETDWERESVEMARAQLESKVEKAASALASKGEFLGADDADVEIAVYLSCPECTTRVPFESGRRQGYVCEEHSPTLEEVGMEPTDGTEATEPERRDPVIDAVSRFSS